MTGGSSSLQGMVELGEEIFLMPVRLGLPDYRGSLAEVVRSPRYSTGLACSGRHGAAAAASAYAVAGQLVQAHSGKDEKLVSRQFLRVLSKTRKNEGDPFGSEGACRAAASEAERLK